MAAEADAVSRAALVSLKRHMKSARPTRWIYRSNIAARARQSGHSPYPEPIWEAVCTLFDIYARYR